MLASTTSQPNRSLVSRILGAIPGLVILAALGSVFAWGHSTNWDVPKFSHLLNGPSSESKDWCEEHGLPHSICVECNSTLMARPKAMGWCKEHGVHECALCNLSLAQHRTRPQITELDYMRARRALALTPRYENNPICKMHQRRIQFANREAADKAGIDVKIVGRSRIVEAISANGELSFDPTRVAHLSARTPGSVWRVFKHIGDSVKAGELLALVDAAEVGKTKAELQQARAELTQATDILDKMRKTPQIAQLEIARAQGDFNKAQIRVATAQQALLNLGFALPQDRFASIPDNRLGESLHRLGLPENFDLRTATANLLPIYAPQDGIVVSREIVAGEVVDTSRILFELVDPRFLWLTLDVRSEEIDLVRPGLEVVFTPDGRKPTLQGKISWINNATDHTTRTVKVRAELLNPEGNLRANTYGSGQIILREEPDAIVVPNESIQFEGDCYVVFVRDRNFLKEESYKVFHTRTIRLGVRNGKFTEVIAGVLPGEVIVTKGSDVLRTELLRGSLGEG
jgi:cobalt-zinc-cadmium efflux system membrane fusion protein